MTNERNKSVGQHGCRCLHSSKEGSLDVLNMDMMLIWVPLHLFLELTLISHLNVINISVSLSINRFSGPLLL